eukprot:362359-Chlamydomonas_euryale.AAC.1
MSWAALIIQGLASHVFADVAGVAVFRLVWAARARGPLRLVGVTAEAAPMVDPPLRASIPTPAPAAHIRAVLSIPYPASTSMGLRHPPLTYTPHATCLRLPEARTSRAAAACA